MSLIETLNFTTNERQFVKLKNHPTGQTNRVTYHAYGTFDSGTVAVQVSPDGGTTWIDNIDAGSALTFSAAESRSIESNSDEQNPVYLGFNLTGATSPDLNITVYDNK